MKTTRTTRLLFILCLLFLYSCGNKENKQSENESKVSEKTSTKKDDGNIVAKMDKGKLVFTNKKKAVAMLEKSMGTSRASEMNMNSLKLDVSKATDNEKVEVVQLVVSSKDETEKTALLLVRRANGYEVSTKKPLLTCTGCSVGCSPRRAVNGDGYCTPCQTKGDCEKTETLQESAQ